MPYQSVVLVVPGALATRTGGYGYDRRIVDGLRALDWDVSVRELPGRFPQPDVAALAAAGEVFAALPDGALVLVDGLALGALPDVAEREAARLALVALVHHPLANETGLDPLSQASLFASETRALAAARLVVVTSSATARALARYGVTEDRIVVVRPGTDPAPLAHGTRRRDASAARHVVLLTVATLVPRKGHDVLLEALGRLRQLPWQLVCAGSDTLDPDTARRLREQARQLEIAGQIRFAGELEGHALADVFDRADVFVLPTRYEGYGMAVAEAVAHGLPVVATATGAIPELVDDTSGVLVPIDDPEALSAALQRVISDDDLRARLIAGAQRRRHGLPTWSQATELMAGALVRAQP